MTREEAIRVALTYVEAQGWLRSRDAEATLRRQWWLWGRRFWEVAVPEYHTGTYAWVYVDDESGEVLRAGFIPR